MNARKLSMTKLPAKYAAWIMSLLLSGLMSGTLSLINMLINLGLTTNFISHWLNAWMLSWLIAYPVVLIFLPLVRRFDRLNCGDAITLIDPVHPV